MMWLNGSGERRVATNRRMIEPTPRLVVSNGVCQRGWMMVSRRLSNGKTREARAFLPQYHLQRWKCQQDADEGARPRDQADEGNEQHYDAERALVQARDEPRDRHVVRRRISEQCLQHHRRRDACAVMRDV